MKKGLTKIFTFIILISTILITNIPKLNAASGTMSVTSSKSTVVVGSEIRVTVKLSSSTAFGSWQFKLQYDSSKLKYVSGDPLSVVGYTSSQSGDKSKTYTYTFKAIAKGTSTISLAATDMATFIDVEHMGVTTKSTKITAITQAELEASYSKNNNLASLGVEGYNLNETFNKDTLEYTVTVPSEIEKVNLTGTVEDNKASITGLGEKEVSEGENKFDIVVTAENGSQKTYTLKVNVEDSNPIEVTIDGIKYTVVKRGNSLTAPTTFEITTIKINDIEVPAFKSNITGFTLVGLKNPDGETNLYIYDEETGTYTLYKELKTEGILLFPTIAKTSPEYYKKTKVTINGEELEAYQYDGVEDYYLIYGINIETGSEGFYQYDMVNNTITRYNDKIINELTKKNENFLMIIIVLGVETIVMILILLITLIKRNKTSKPKNKKNNFKEFEKQLENEEVKKEKDKSKEVKEKDNKEEKDNKDNKEEKNSKENKEANKNKKEK